MVLQDAGTAFHYEDERIGVSLAEHTAPRNHLRCGLVSQIRLQELNAEKRGNVIEMT